MERIADIDTVGIIRYYADEITRKGNVHDANQALYDAGVDRKIVNALEYLYDAVTTRVHETYDEDREQRN